MLYCRPCFTRGHGLGNRLFPWARARLFAASTGARFIDPVWVRPALGPMLRGGIALRHYRSQILLLGLFRRRPGDLGVLQGWWVARGATRISEPAATIVPRTSAAATADDVLVEFRGYEGYFAPLLGREELLRSELRAVARPRLLLRADRLGPVPIAINVRCGRDFPKASPGAERIAPGEATPLGWFVEALRLVRRSMGARVPAFVVSDGGVGDLAVLLAEPEVRLVRPGCAVTDLLVLLRARVLLASGSSSFGAWAAFLGGMPAATHPGQPLAAWALPPEEGEALRVELDTRRPDDRFLRVATGRLRGSEGADTWATC